MVANSNPESYFSYFGFTKISKTRQHLIIFLRLIRYGIEEIIKKETHTKYNKT